MTSDAHALDDLGVARSNASAIQDPHQARDPGGDDLLFVVVQNFVLNVMCSQEAIAELNPRKSS